MLGFFLAAFRDDKSHVCVLRQQGETHEELEAALEERFPGMVYEHLHVDNVTITDKKHAKASQ